MPHYHLHLHESGEVVVDAEGIERADLAQARSAAIEGARDIMCADLAAGRLSLSRYIEVHDEAGAVVVTVPFKDAVTVTGL